MKKSHKKALFIFRRDLRLADNTGLNAALQASETVIPCFIFDPRQIGAKNRYKSTQSVQFMIESLTDLDAQLHKKQSKLYTFYGKPEDIIQKLVKKAGTEAVFVNQDYTPFSIQRDHTIARVCKKLGVDFFSFADTLLVDPKTFTNKQGKPYSVFTPFFNTATKLPIAQPTTKKGVFYDKKILLPALQTIDLKKELTARGKILKTTNPDILVHGGRTESAKILRSLKKFKNYSKTKNIPNIPTTHLSAYNKFGTHSIREVAYAIIRTLGPSHDLIRQLYWRDFYYHIIWHFPHVLGHAFRKKYDKLKWSGTSVQFKKWCSGTTGFPLIDAGMRQLSTTGFMHNRVRMTVASFLTKDLHIDWQKGERYFAKQLVDYDPAVNNGNWQWAASTGCDPQPYFRIFNPWLQQKKFDPECEYIKKWVPELRDYTAKEIHNSVKKPLKGYPEPMIDHKKERERALLYYKKAR